MCRANTLPVDAIKQTLNTFKNNVINMVRFLDINDESKILKTSKYIHIKRVCNTNTFLQ